jgi:hypothetical protein
MTDATKVHGRANQLGVSCIFNQAKISESASIITVAAQVMLGQKFGLTMDGVESFSTKTLNKRQAAHGFAFL